MKDVNLIKEEVRNYLLDASLSDPGKIDNETLIFDNGILDSMGLLFLIEFLTEKYLIEVNDEELVPKNFESINNISHFVQQKL